MGRERERAKEKARYERRKAAGVCLKCGKETKGGRFCEVHRVKNNLRGQRLRAKLRGKRRKWERTPEQKALKLERARVRREKRIAAQVCAACGGPREPKRRTCDKCRERDTKRRAEIVAQRKENGFCVCGKPLLPQGSMCETCWYRHKAGKGSGLSRTDWQSMKQLLESQGYRCAYSGKLLVVGSRDASIDHKIPRSRGGTNDISNLQWVTKRVNQMKTDFTHEEFIGACRVIAEKWQKKQNQLRIA